MLQLLETACMFWSDHSNKGSGTFSRKIAFVSIVFNCYFIKSFQFTLRSVAGFACHAIKNKTLNPSINNKNLRYHGWVTCIKNLAKIKVGMVFHNCIIWRNVSPKFIELCMGHHVGVHLSLSCY